MNHDYQPQEIDEPEHTTRQQLSPASPRPQAVPSPSNIPILALSMDDNFHESLQNNGTSTPASAQFASKSQSQSQSQTPNPFVSTPYPADPSNAAYGNYQNAGGQGGEGGALAFARSAGVDTEDTSIQSQTPGHIVHSSYPFAYNTAPAQPAHGAHFQTTEGNAVDVQALLDSLTPSVQNAPSSQYAAPQMSPQSMQAQSSASLPPRPPAQDQPSTHPNYNPNDDIRSFHPHSQQVSNTQQRTNGGQLQPLNVRGHNHTSMSQGGAQSPKTPGNVQPSQQGPRTGTPDDEDIRWPPEINKKYEDFLDQERKFVTDGQWDQFPMGSRLFIGKAAWSLSKDHLTPAGNLPTEKVTKRDIFHRFYRHGRLAQISIKQAYGFVQFLDAESCGRALDAEQGQAVRGRKMRKQNCVLLALCLLTTNRRSRGFKAAEEFAKGRHAGFRTTTTFTLARL
jgi:hypothetical protein